MWCIKDQLNWLRDHAEWDPTSRHQVCRETRVPIEGVTIGRSVHTMPDILAGDGEVRAVSHWFCPAHGGVPSVPHGTPIAEDNLVQVSVQT